MTEETLQPLETALEELAMAVMLVNGDDLPALGQILKTVEEVKAQAEILADPGLSHLGALLQTGLEKAILAELGNAPAFVELLPEVVSAMQELLRLRLKSGQASQAPADLTAKLSEVVGLTTGQTPAETKPSPPPAAGGLPPDLDLELARGFIGESLDLLQEIEVAILAVEKDPTDPEVINAIFRPFHTIKGVSGFLNLTDINRFAHAVENLLDEARSSKIRLEGPVVDLILDAVDMLRVMITDLSTQLHTGRPTGEEFGLEEFLRRLEIVREAAFQAMAGEKVPLGQLLVAQGTLEPEDLTKGLGEQRSQNKPLGSLLVETGAATPRAVVRGLREQKAAQAEGASVKVDTAKLDNMVDAVGELVIALSLVAENPHVQAIHDRKLERDMAQLGRITSELQKTAMSLRMVPIKQTFQRMSRVVRDLSRKSGKPADLVMEGQDTEIDRNMVEAIYDPLVHMVRNSMDHGLESPSDRAAASKPESGVVAIRAYHQGGKIVIEIEDDGRGLDPDRILAKALEKGLVPPETKLSETEIYQLILHPGFSTAERVTDISGRGVGMDVVAKAVEELRGNLEISSRKGQGSKFTIRLPLTMAIIEGMVVLANGERYIIPALSVEEVLKPEPQAFHTAGGGKGEMVMVRGRLLPMINLSRLFGGDGGKGRDGVVVVVESEGRRKAVVVDELLGKQEVVIKSLGEAMGQMKGLSGGAILGDGRVGLIIDSAGLFHIAEHGGGLAA